MESIRRITWSVDPRGRWLRDVELAPAIVSWNRSEGSRRQTCSVMETWKNQFRNLWCTCNSSNSNNNSNPKTLIRLVISFRGSGSGSDNLEIALIRQRKFFLVQAGTLGSLRRGGKAAAGCNVVTCFYELSIELSLMISVVIINTSQFVP